MKALAAKSLINDQLSRTKEIIDDISKSEFKVYSQWGDDGIIQFLTQYLDIPRKTFIEFGVEDYNEANTRFLLENNNWQGLVMDGSSGQIEKIKGQSMYWRHTITAHAAFITAENINDILSGHGFSGNIGLLHIDLDGNDYWVWKAIDVVKPVIVIMEYNSLFGPDKPWTIPYDPSFQRTEAHFSNLYFGSSLTSLCDLAVEKGYSFIGTNSNGNNAYFVRTEELKGLKSLSVQEGFRPSYFREGRDIEGNLTYDGLKERYAQLEGQKIYNTRTKSIELIP